MILFLYVCKQTFHLSRVRITQKVNPIIMRNLRHFIFMWRQRYMPSKHLLVFKTSSRHVLKMSSVRLQRNNFSSSKASWRRLEDISQDVLKTCWRHVLKMFAKRLGDKQNVFWGYLYLTNLNVYLTNLVFHKPISDEFKVNPKCIN